MNHSATQANSSVGKHALTLLACVIAAAGAYASSRLAFCGAPLTTDENSCVLQANNFLDGLLFRPYPAIFASQLKQKQVIYDDEKGMFSRYAPGHIIWLMPGVLLGDPYIISAIGAALVVLIMIKCGALLDIPRVVTVLFLLLSPYFIMSFGTLLSHTSGLVASSLMLFSYVLWRRSGLVRFTLIAGLAWGWLFHNRTLTAVCLSVPFGADALFRLWVSRNRKTLKGVCVFACTAAACMGLLLLYNRLLTGNALSMTHLFYDPSEGIGFGPRHTKGIVIHHDLSNGLKNLWDNLSHMDLWLFGFRGSLMFALLLAAIGWHRAWTPLLAGSWTSVWIGYICFWYPGPKETGPGYYLETLPFLCVASGMGMARLWSWSSRFQKWRAAAAILLTALLAILSMRFMLASGRDARARFYDRGKMTKFCRAAPPDSLLFVTPCPLDDYMINNPRGVNSKPLMMLTREGADKAAMRYFSDRTPYYLFQNGTSYSASFSLVPANTNVPYALTLTPDSMSYFTGANILRDGKTLREARQGIHEKGWLAFGRRACLFPGRFTIRYALEVSGCPDDGTACILDVAADNGRRILAKKMATGSPEPDDLAIELVTDDFVEAEPRVYYTGIGNITLVSISVSEAP